MVVMGRLTDWDRKLAAHISVDERVTALLIYVYASIRLLSHRKNLVEQEVANFSPWGIVACLRITQLGPCQRRHSSWLA